MADKRSYQKSGSPSSSLFSTPEYRAFLFTNGAWTFAWRALQVVIGFQIYELTKNPLDLGWLGLLEAIPGFTLVLYGGHHADRHDRRFTIIWGRGALAILSAVLAVVPLSGGVNSTTLLLGVAFLAACVRAFADPAAAALEGQIVPRQAAVQSGVMLGTAFQLMWAAGPVVSGLVYDVSGPAGTYGVIAAVCTYSALAMFWVGKRPLPPVREEVGAWQSIRDGIKYVFSNQILVGSMALDLFAVLFGGAVALLPIFASDILKVGATGFGLLNAAPALGSLGVMIIALRNPPRRHAGRLLHISVAGFGISIIFFGLSENFLLSLVLLTISGAFDGVSVVTRRTISRLMVPHAMRGRIAAVSTVFIGSSNELGAFESGFAASIFGTARSVWLGGLLTLFVVAITAVKAPKLFNLDLDQAANDPDT
jgi:MFS family permease